ncbi:MAG: preprotein translocase subunit YajC [Spirochaetales bacterium]|nr:preprotein translocase subunit YajC [Spirochaetales bacterium]
MYQLFSLPLLQLESAMGSQSMSIVMLVSIFAIFYFLLIRPQRKKEKERQAMIDAVKKGDKVTTIGGIVGTVTNIDADKGTVTVKVDDNTKIKFTKSAVSSVENKDDVKGDDKTAVEDASKDKKKK